ncbi:hypothetical protein HYPSUDRAFT_38763 [Hypholoma sublateritium FD-334 SS-4]|uniref:Uncharacterized protein n=1 Tax=Hypholoma sublateritium (strain FD-334 SS-4) TaxID=945553 RepID=A0A0D2MLH5_HYPSF|nr:hypothetical protein HYPSUDRAFT_38763 [Hypholoma sublateritium FD-334 SS-4]
MAAAPPATNPRWARSADAQPAFGKPARGRPRRGPKPADAPDAPKPAARRAPRAAPPPDAQPAPSRRRAPKPKTSPDPRRARRPPAPLAPAPAPAKDTPPHLRQDPPPTPRTDIRTDVAALVERVRASAMDHRPSTPGTHIDWAGDDDDSLPDLDDWGVSHADLISPIIVDGLRALPDVAPPAEEPTPTPSPVEIREPTPPVEVREPTPPVEVREPTPPVEIREPTPPPVEIREPTPPPEPRRNPLHPSLPAKPAAAPVRPKAPKEDPLDDFRRPDGLSASIHAPAPIDASSLAASIHAPRADAASAPPSVSVFADAPQTHTRAHTVGRPDGLLPPSAPRASRSGRATPVSRGVHARTHSTPPALSHRARPVLTGAAISSITRTIKSVVALGGAD